MSTLTVFSATTDGYLQNPTAGVYADAYTNFVPTANTALTTLYIGQNFSGVYALGQSYVSFDTSALGASAVISAATFSLYGSTDGTVTDVTLRARLYNWGPAVDSTDWKQFAGTLLATFGTAGFTTAGYNDFTENGTNLQTNIAKTGTTWITITSNTFESGTAPTGNESVNVFAADQTGTANDPKLVVTYTAIPNAPTSPTATAISATQINVGWTASAVDSTHDAASTYDIDRAPDVAGSPGTFANIVTGVVGTSYSDTGLTPTTKYWYRIRGVNVAGSSANSTNATATTLTSLPFLSRPRMKVAVIRAATR